MKMNNAYIPLSLIFPAISLILLFVISSGCKKEKLFTVGIVNVNPGLEAVVDGFKSGMAAKYGYVEGKNITYVYKGALNVDLIDTELKDLKTRRVDLILALTTHVAVKAKKAVEGTKIPVVFAPVLFPVRAGLVKSLKHPDGNLTGIQVGGSTDKALEFLKSAVPGTKNIFVPYYADEGADYSLSDLKEAAGKLGVKLIIKEVRNINDLKAAMEFIPGEADSIWLLNSSFLVSNIDLFVTTAIKRKLPLSSVTSQYRAGVMISYGQVPFRTGEQASRLAHSILRGTSPADLPVEITDFSLGINLKTAQAAGIEIPNDILQQANFIIRK